MGNAIYTAGGNATELAFLAQLVAQFNIGLNTFSTKFKAEVTTGHVSFFDLATLWRSFQSSPKTYGITASPVTKPCYNSTTGSLCTNPSAYLFYDTLHPVTTIHKAIAGKINALVNAAL